ncbi:MAG: M48 family metallopeptidase [Candidatus Obscuribacterales bacterium]|nr:M48 family metallopeptidase [Steroidobacteraceae bacterium]
MHSLTVFFLIAVLTSTMTRWWLSARQIRAVSAHRDKVPAAFASQIDLAAHTKAADYTIARERFGHIDLAVDVGILLLLTLGGGIEYIDAQCRRLELSGIWHGTLVILTVMFVQTLVTLPLTAWQTFKIEARFGFNRTTPKLFAVDLVKGWVLALALGVPLLAAILYLMERAGSVWWLYAWALFTVFTVVIQWAYPAFIAPWFNKFTPLADQTLQHRITSLLQRCGFKAQGVFVMNGSLRSAHGNAYFTGFGKTKRVVFFDTLMERLEVGEIEGVLAHELGHYRRHHIRNRLILSLAMSFGGFALLGWLAKWPDFYTALGVAAPSAHAALLLFMLTLSPVLFWITPLAAWWSRQHEFEADEFAAEHANSSELASALTKLYRDNATTLTPDDWHSAFYDSHPTALIRIARLQQLATRT